MQITPIKQWRRPLFKAKEIPFTVQLKPLDSYPLKINELASKLYWLPRPWWQFLLFILLVLLLLGSVGWLILKLLKYSDFKAPKSSPEISLNSFYNLYHYNDTIFLNFKVNNLPFRVENTIISIFEGEKEIKKYEVQELLKQSKINEENKSYSEGCVYNPSPFYELSCLNINTEISQPGDYNFRLEISKKNSSEKITSEEKFSQSIKQPPKPKIDEIQLSNTQISPNQTFNLNFSLANYEQIQTLKITSNPTSENQELNQQELAQYCQNNNMNNKCNLSIPLTISNAGKYKFTITATSLYEKDNETPISTTTDEIIVKNSLKIDYFKANSQSSNISPVKYGDTIILDWDVIGDNVQVKIEYLESDLPTKAKAKLRIYPDQDFEITLKAEDSFGDLVEQKLFIKVIKNNSISPSLNNDIQQNEVIEVPDLLK